jgi:hypothetical protein
LYRLALAEDLLASNLIYFHKYFHIFSYFISQDMMKNSGLASQSAIAEGMGNSYQK